MFCGMTAEFIAKRTNLFRITLAERPADVLTNLPNNSCLPVCQDKNTKATVIPATARLRDVGAGIPNLYYEIAGRALMT